MIFSINRSFIFIFLLAHSFRNLITIMIPLDLVTDDPNILTGIDLAANFTASFGKFIHTMSRYV